MLEKEFRFQVIFTSNILLLRVFPGYLNLKLKFFTEQIQNPRYIKNSVNIPYENLAY